MQKTAWLRGFLPKYPFYIHRMCLPYKKDACDLFDRKKARFYAGLWHLE